MSSLVHLDWSAPTSMPGYTAVTLWDRELAVATGKGPDRRTARFMLSGWRQPASARTNIPSGSPGEYLVLTGTYPDRLR
jgi:hypothetical protein